MPVYEYECKHCRTRFEKMQSITAEPLTECLNCGQGPVRRVIQPAGVIFKGSGWYITDSRKSAAPKDGAEGKPDAKDQAPKEGADKAATPAKQDAPAASTSAD